MGETQDQGTQDQTEDGADELAGEREVDADEGTGAKDPERAPDLGAADPGASVGIILARAANAQARRLRAALRPHRLSAAQYLLLAGIAARADEPPSAQSQSRLAARLGMDRAMASTVLAQLESARLVARAPGADRRSRAPTLTQLGREKLAAARPAVDAAEAQFIAPLRGETATFAIMLRLLLGERPRIRATAGRG